MRPRLRDSHFRLLITRENDSIDFEARASGIPSCRFHRSVDLGDFFEKKKKKKKKKKTIEKPATRDEIFGTLRNVDVSMKGDFLRGDV